MTISYKYFIVLGCIILFSSCKEDKKISVDPRDSFQYEDYLTSINLPISQSINQAYELLQVDDFLIVSDPDEFYHFKLFDIKDQKIIGRFGKIGDGPCEIFFPTSLQRIATNSNTIGLNNRRKFQFLEVNLDSIIKGGKYGCDYSTKSFDTDYQKIVKLDHENFVGVGLFEKRFALSKLNEKEPYYLGLNYPFESEFPDYNHEVLAMAYQGNLIVNPNKDRFFFSSTRSANLDIIEYQRDKLKPISINHFWPPVFTGSSGSSVQAKMSIENKAGFLSASGTEKYIYLLFSGKKASENSNYSDVILVYDWNGDPVKKILLDVKVNLISVSEDDEKIIAYFDDGKPNLILFDINE